MATSTTVHMHDAGVVFLITVQDETDVVDLTSVQNLDLYFQKPDRSIISRTCDVVNGTSGLIRYVSQYNDFDQSGIWKVQLIVRFADNNIKHSNVGTLNVAANISTL